VQNTVILNPTAFVLKKGNASWFSGLLDGCLDYTEVRLFVKVSEGGFFLVQSSGFRCQGSGISVHYQGSEQRQYLFHILIKKLPYSLLILAPRCGKRSAMVRAEDYPEFFRLTRSGE
jgi:hypothetical protein